MADIREDNPEVDHSLVGSLVAVQEAERMGEGTQVRLEQKLPLLLSVAWQAASRWKLLEATRGAGLAAPIPQPKAWVQPAPYPACKTKIRYKTRLKRTCSSLQRLPDLESADKLISWLSGSARQESRL